LGIDVEIKMRLTDIFLGNIMACDQEWNKDKEIYDEWSRVLFSNCWVYTIAGNPVPVRRHECWDIARFSVKILISLTF
jgi:hypothetical protein